MVAPSDAIPDDQSLMLPVLRAVEHGEMRIGDVVDALAEALHLDDDSRSIMLPSGRQTLLSNRVHWARFYLGKAGLVEATGRGRFKISDRGLDALVRNPERIDNRFLNQFEEFRRFRDRTPRSNGSAEPESSEMLPAQTPDDIMLAAHRNIEAALAQDLLDRLRSAPPSFFERLIVSLLLAMGYGGSAAEAGRALGRSGDDGIDGVIDQDPLGLDRVYVQAKRYAATNSVGSGAIRDFFGSLDRHKASKGLFVTSSSFSASARETAEFLSKRIVLIDGDQLTRLMIRHNIGCRIEETLYIKKVDEDFFD